MEDQRWIPIPLRLVLWNPGDGALVVRVDPPTLQNAPFFEEDQFPDATMEGWNSEFETYWQNSGAGGGTGTGTGTGQATATATP
jgi:hypothetical protein